jgi:hypothetical protein
MSLAEDNDFGGSLPEYRRWLEQRGEEWVCKSPDHIAHMEELIDTFPEARFLICMREAGATLASIREYWQLLGVGPNYDIGYAVRELSWAVSAYPERFDWINVQTIPEWESNRSIQTIPSSESSYINNIYARIKGEAKRVDSRDFRELYQREDLRTRTAQASTSNN